MSILSSANSGKLRVVTNELSNILHSGVKFEVYTDKEDGEVYTKLKPELWNGSIYIPGSKLPCKIAKFEAAPNLHFLDFYDPKHFSLLPQGFQRMCIKYTFQNCKFNEFTLEHLITNTRHIEDHIERSEIYISHFGLKNGGVPYIEDFEKNGIETISLLYDLSRKENKFFVLRTDIEPDFFSPKWEHFNPNLNKGRYLDWREITRDEIRSLFLYNERYKRELDEKYLNNRPVKVFFDM